MTRTGLVFRLQAGQWATPNFSLARDHAACWTPDPCMGFTQPVDDQWDFLLAWNSRWATSQLVCNLNTIGQCPAPRRLYTLSRQKKDTGPGSGQPPALLTGVLAQLLSLTPTPLQAFLHVSQTALCSSWPWIWASFMPPKYGKDLPADDPGKWWNERDRVRGDTAG